MCPNAKMSTLFLNKGGKEWGERALSEELCGNALPDHLWPQLQEEALTGNEHFPFPFLFFL